MGLLSKAADTIYAFRFLKLLTTPFNKTKAFELGIIDEKGKIKSIGKKTKLSDAPKTAEKIDLQGNIAIPGIVDMKAFVGEPGF